ncbi:MAG: hypothetical protein H6Q81_2693 [Deltaproteobacteria bacterium]|nr:hypothetical protein [Deltaproteobacteria bacterium]
MVYCFSHTLYGKKMATETKYVTSRNPVPEYVTNIVMEIHEEEESQSDMGSRGGVPVTAEWRGGGRSQTVTFPWWVPKTERITSEISPSVA